MRFDVPGVLALVILAAPLAAAAEPADAPVASAAGNDALDAQIAAFVDQAPDAAPVRTAPDSTAADAPPAPDRKMHGEVGVGVGTGGYREAHAVVVAPVGKTGTVAIAVGQAHGRGFLGPIGPGGPIGVGPGRGPAPDVALADGACRLREKDRPASAEADLPICDPLAP